MKYLLMIYNDNAMLDALPAGEADSMMRECFAHADGLRASGRLLDSMMLESPESATSVRIRGGRVTTTDGPFAETKEHLGGFNLIEARDLNEAILIAKKFPWARTGCVEIRPIRELESARPKDLAAAEAAK